MINITTEQFAKMYVKNNRGKNFKEVKSNLQTALSRKKVGAVCVVCGQPVCE